MGTSTSDLRLTVLTPKQEQAIAALLAQPSITKAAESLKMSERTLRRWLKENPAFLTRYQWARTEIVERTARFVQSTGMTAAITLLNIVRDEKQPATARVSAARKLLDKTFATFEQIDLVPRLEAVERSVLQTERELLTTQESWP